MKNLSIKAKLYIILAIGTIGSLLVGLYVNITFGEIANNNPDIASGLNAINIYIAILIIIDALVVLFVAKQINESVRSISHGVKSFFDFLEQRSNDFEPIVVKNKDELGFISNELNEHAALTKKALLLDRKLIDELDDVLEKIDNGFFMYQVKSSTTNKQLESLKNKINGLSSNINKKFNVITKTLMEYGESNFEYTMDEKEKMNGAYGSLRASSKLIGNNVSELLAMIMNSGTKLNTDTDVLSQASAELSTSSNNQAASLEETAAALEEVTATITNNTADINKMNNLAVELNQSVKEGSSLATQTNNAMEEIDTKVSAINEAITIIDQIAFQTNILSLNAAVEAATAGEAGKGFAVVAQEVRNLASRSAEAANEIKSIVETAKNKASSGKEIANKMINGYEKINTTIEQTTSLISNVANASKEQEAAIHQINDAVTLLDHATQQNASKASEISRLSNEISALSSGLITAANRAKFNRQTSQYVCDVDLVFTTAKLKNDHIRFKETNYGKLGENTSWKVVDHHSCALGKWIDEAEKANKKFTKTDNWKTLKEIHSQVHGGVQSFIDANAINAANEQLKQLASNIENATIGVFEGLNRIKIDNCSNPGINSAHH